MKGIMPKSFTLLFVVLLAFGVLLGACSSTEPPASAEKSEPAQEEAAEAPAEESEPAEEETTAESEPAAEEAAATEYKIAWYASAPHPYFEEVLQGVEAFEAEYGIPIEKQIGPDWEQASQNERVEALAAQGFKYISIYPTDASGANGLYEELTANDVKVINFGASTLEPTTASFVVATDAKAAAMQATEALIESMGGQGKIINVLEVLEDSNTVLRKEGR